MTNFSAALRASFLFTAILVISAEANPLTMTLKDSDGTGHVVDLSIADNSFLDSNPAAGAITYAGTIRGITGVFTGTGTHLNGMPSFEFSGTYSNTGYAGLIGYLYFGDFGPINPNTPFLKDTVSIQTTGLLNFTHQTFEDSLPVFDWGSLGTTLTDQRADSGYSYFGEAGSLYSNSPISFSQLISIASYDNSTTTFTASSVVAEVPENFRTLGFLTAVSMVLFGLRRTVRGLKTKAVAGVQTSA